MNAPLIETTYTPESPLRNPAALIRAMASDLVRSKELAWRLFVRDISALYRQSVLGYLWAFLPPLATTVTFTFLSSQQILSLAPTPIPYPAYVLMGTLLWQSFMDAVASPLKAVNQSKSMLTKIYFPREALIIGGFAEVIFNMLVRMLLLVPVFFYFKLPVTLSLLAAPLALAALVLLGLSIGLILAPVGMLYTDVGRGINLVGGFWMLLTPVVYPPPAGGFGATLAQLNPVSPLLMTCRELLTGIPLSHLGSSVCIAAVTVLLLLAGWLVYRLAMPILIERMGS